MKKLLPILCLLAACTTPATKQQTSKSAIAINNVNIVNVADGSIAQEKYLLIDSGRIISISDKAYDLAKNTKSIDGTGKYIMPGLAEMHAHIPPEPAGKEHIENMLFLYLSNGVTTIRGMLGHPHHLTLRQQALDNKILSPRIYTSSPSLNGNTIKTPEEAREKVTNYGKDGYDFLKIHPGIKLEVFEELVKTANEVGIPFAGHVPVDVGIRRAIQSQYTSIDHVDGYLEGLVPASANVVPNENGFFGYNFTPLADESLIEELVALTKKHNVWVVPTQSLFDRWFSPEDPEVYAQAPEMKYMPQSTIDQWIQSKARIIGNEKYNAEQWSRFNEIRNKLIYALQQSSPGLLLGSDAPQVFNVPGFSIHHELQGMLKAGLTPLEAIQIGTINPAVFFGQKGQYGEVLEGASADLILLAANPLDDLNNLKNPNGVMVRGKWLNREDIDKKLAKIAKYSVDK